MWSYIWVQLLLVSLSIRFLDRGSSGWCCSLSCLLLLVLLSLLVALLQFGLGDPFAGDLVEMEVCHRLCGSGWSCCVRHDCCVVFWLCFCDVLKTAFGK